MFNFVRVIVNGSKLIVGSLDSSLQADFIKFLLSTLKLVHDAYHNGNTGITGFLDGEKE